MLQRSYVGTCNYRDRELIVQKEMTGVGRGDPLKNENFTIFHWDNGHHSDHVEDD